MKFDEIDSSNDISKFFEERSFPIASHDKFLFQIDNSKNFLKIFIVKKIDKEIISDLKKELKKIKNCHYGAIFLEDFSSSIFLSVLGKQITLTEKNSRSDTLASIHDKLSKIDYSNDIYNQSLMDLFDVAPIVSKFYNQYETIRTKLISSIENLNNRALYAQILLDRIIFLYFLQTKGILPEEYLSKLYNDCIKTEKNFYDDYLKILFFELLNSEIHNPHLEKTFGKVPYLNGGLFRKKSYENNTISISNEIWAELFELFREYHWVIHEDKGGLDSLTPEILGHIFEKTVNQKASGAYYTPSQLTSYMAENTVNRLVVEKFNIEFNKSVESVNEIITSKNPKFCEWLYENCLSNLKILDNACGSGAFLLSTANILFEYYKDTLSFLTTTNEKYKNSIDKNLNYFIKKKIITENIHGVDMEEGGVEICKLRLWLSMVSEIESENKINPLPNIDYNIMSGNSLIGFHKQENVFYKNQTNLDSFLGKSVTDIFKKLIEQKKDYKSTSNSVDAEEKKKQLENKLDLFRHELDEQLWADFENLGITLSSHEKQNLKPFHWIIEFPEVFYKNNGFDIIIGNPPWEIWKPEEKDYYAQYDPGITKTTEGKELKKLIGKIKLENPEIEIQWKTMKSFVKKFGNYLNKSSRFPYCSETLQPSTNDKISSDLDLYKFFLERMHQLLTLDGRCAVIIPSSFNTTLGSCGLRQMIFDTTKVDQMIDFDNRYGIFDIHRGKHFLILIFKMGGETEEFPAAFSVSRTEYLKHLSDISFNLKWSKIKKLSPRSYSILSISNQLDYQIIKKAYQFPFLGDFIKNKWNVSFTREMDISQQSHLFRPKPKTESPFFRGGMIQQYTSRWIPNKDWTIVTPAKEFVSGKIISRLQKALGEALGDKIESKNRTKIIEKILGRKISKKDIVLDSDFYRLGFRNTTGLENERGIVSQIIPKNVFCGNSCQLIIPTKIEINDIYKLPKDLKTLFTPSHSLEELFFIQAMFNSFVVDFILRKKVLENVNFFFVQDLPIPRLQKKDKYFQILVEKAVTLVSQDEEFYGELPSLLGIEKIRISEKKRIQLRTEIEAIIGKIYGLTRDEFLFILSTFDKKKTDYDFISLEKENKTKIDFDEFSSQILSYFEKL